MLGEQELFLSMWRKFMSPMLWLRLKLQPLQEEVEDEVEVVEERPRLNLKLNHRQQEVLEEEAAAAEAGEAQQHLRLPQVRSPQAHLTHVIMDALFASLSNISINTARN
jgi:hypothetical protein